MEHYMVFRRFIADQLLIRGFLLLRIKPDKIKKGESIFYFKKEDGIIEAIEEIRKESR